MAWGRIRAALPALREYATASHHGRGPARGDLSGRSGVDGHGSCRLTAPATAIDAIRRSSTATSTALDLVRSSGKIRGRGRGPGYQSSRSNPALPAGRLPAALFRRGFAAARHRGTSAINSMRPRQQLFDRRLHPRSSAISRRWKCRAADASVCRRDRRCRQPMMPRRGVATDSEERGGRSARDDRGYDRRSNRGGLGSAAAKLDRENGRRYIHYGTDVPGPFGLRVSAIRGDRRSLAVVSDWIFITRNIAGPSIG